MAKGPAGHAILSQLRQSNAGGHLGGQRSRVNDSTWAGNICMGQENSKQHSKNKLKTKLGSKRHTAEKCDHWMAKCLLEEQAGQAGFFFVVVFSFKEAMQVPCHT